MSPDLCRPWEKRARPGRGSSPHRVRRGFRHLQEQVGTPARVPKRSGPGPGRPRGGKNRPAPRYPVWTKRIKQTPCWSAGREEELNLKFRWHFIMAVMPNLYELAARATGRAMGALSRRAPAPRRTFSDLPADTRDITVPTRHGQVRCTVYRPSGASASTPVYVNVHGGGFVIRLPEQDDAWCRYLMTHADVVVLNVDYDTAPQHPFPISVEQVHDVVVWASDPAREWDGSRLGIGGQSAGGSLSAAVARMVRDAGGPTLALQILHYPVLDMVTPPNRKPGGQHNKVPPPWMSRVFGLCYAPDSATRKNPLVSPAWGPNSENLAGMAPAVVVTAEHDALRDEAVRYARALEGAGVLREHHDVPGVDHGYDIQDRTPLTTERVYSLLAGHVRRVVQQS